MATATLPVSTTATTTATKAHKSFLQKIEGAPHTFASWFTKEWKKLYAAQPKIEQVADAVLKYAGPALQIAATAVAGAPGGAAVSAVLADAQTSIAAVSGLVADFGATPTAASVISGVQANLQQLLAAEKITNPQSQAAVEKVVTELEALGSAISAAVSAAQASASTPASTSSASSVAPVVDISVDQIPGTAVESGELVEKASAVQVLTQQ